MTEKFLRKIGLGYLAIDLRSLALARVAVGIVLIIDWFYRFTNAFDFYTDAGLVPRGQAITNYTNPYYFSFLFTAGKPIYIYVIFLIGLLCYLGFTFGYKTKINNILSWMFFVSLSARTAVVSHAGDDLIRLCLFWFIFLPSHKSFSIDSAMENLNENKTEPIAPENRSVLSIASIAIVLQLVVMYVFTAVLKIHPIWNSEASAIYYALELDQFLTWFGVIFRNLPFWLLQFMTRVTFVAELIVPLFVFMPWKNSFFRSVAIATFVSFHFGLFSVFNLGNFPWMCMAYWLILTPPVFWDYVLSKLQKYQSGTTIYFDPECTLCRKVCFILKTILVLKFVKVEPGINSEVLKLIQKNNSWVISTSDSKQLFQFEALTHLISISPFKFLTPFFKLNFVQILGRRLYLRISTNRKTDLSVFKYIRAHKNPELSHWFFQAVVFSLLMIAIYWNFATLKKDDDITLSPSIEHIGSIFRLNQFWTMFAPFPTFEDGWVVTDGQLANGQKWDIYNNKEVTFDRPKSISSTYKNTLWRKYFINVRTKEYEDYRLFLGRYLCRQWNEHHETVDQVQTFKIFYMLDKSKPYGEPKSEIIPEMLWSHDCFSK